MAEPLGRCRELPVRLVLKPGGPVSGRLGALRPCLLLECGERVGEVSPDPGGTRACLAGQAPGEFHRDTQPRHPEDQIREVLPLRGNQPGGTAGDVVQEQPGLAGGQEQLQVRAEAWNTARGQAVLVVPHDAFQSLQR